MRPKMTVRKLEAMIESYRGTGTGDHYTPWILPTKRDTSPSSNQSYVPMPMLTRHCFFLSRGERHLAHVLWWLGATDVREQFPLWPWRHPSPMAEVLPDQRWPDHPGMDAVAAEAAIKIHSYHGMRVSHVLTIDLMVTLTSRTGATRLVGISCKPREQYAKSEFNCRLRERLELDRRYCAAAGIQHLLVHPEQLPATLVRQLEWLAPLAKADQIRGLTGSNEYQRFVSGLSKRSRTQPISTAAREAGKRLCWDHRQIRFATHLALWRQDVAVDLDVPISMASPLMPGSCALRQKLRAQLFGEPA